MEKRYLECNCSTPEHIVRFSWYVDEDDPTFQYLYVEVQLSPYMGFFRRVWNAIKFVFGFGKCSWGDTMMFEGEARELRGILDEYIDNCKDEPVHEFTHHVSDLYSGRSPQ